MNGRVATLIKKELLDLLRNRGALIPVIVVAFVALVIPFVVVIVIPATAGQQLGHDRELLELSIRVGVPDGLSDNARVQLFLFQQFLMVLLLTPVTGAMALAAHSVVGEKQGRTLEPLLATPVGTIELLVAKVLGALIPTVAITLAGLALQFVGMALFADPGVARAMLSARTAFLVFLLAPAAALLSLQAAIVISSRVNDARTAQQFGALIVIPLTMILVAQFAGMFWLTAADLAVIGSGLLAVWIILVFVSAALFERDAILTRWR